MLQRQRAHEQHQQQRGQPQQHQQPQQQQRGQPQQQQQQQPYQQPRQLQQQQPQQQQAQQQPGQLQQQQPPAPYYNNIDYNVFDPRAQDNNHRRPVGGEAQAYLYQDFGADFAFDTPSLKPLLNDDLSFLVSVIVFSMPAFTPFDLSFSFI